MNEQSFDQEKTSSEEQELENDNIIQPEEETYTTAEAEVSPLEKELADVKDKYLRLVAEFDNFRRRNARERNELIATAGKDIIVALLPILDDTERAARLMETQEDPEQIKEGVSLIFNKLHNLLQQKGLQKMESLNQDFDADLHEAITEVPVTEDEKRGKIIDQVECGYYLGEKIIRHAKVVVGK